MWNYHSWRAATVLFLFFFLILICYQKEFPELEPLLSSFVSSYCTGSSSSSSSTSSLYEKCRKKNLRLLGPECSRAAVAQNVHLKGAKRERGLFPGRNICMTVDKGLGCARAPGVQCQWGWEFPGLPDRAASYSHT